MFFYFALKPVYFARVPFHSFLRALRKVESRRDARGLVVRSCGCRTCESLTASILFSHYDNFVFYGSRSRPCCSISSACIVCLPLYLQHTATGTVVNTTYGPVSTSATGNGVTIFRSVRYGASPVGANRFRAPQPPTPWTEVVDTTNEPNSCPQLKLDGNIFVGNEDCLFLSVYVPDACTPTNPCPVAFWIFGGAWILGDATEFGSVPRCFSEVSTATSTLIVLTLPFAGRRTWQGYPHMESCPLPFIVSRPSAGGTKERT